MSDHSKPSLAIALSVKNKNKRKKMAEGGPVSAKAEKRPMPDQTGADSMSVSHNSGDKASHNDSWIDAKMGAPQKRPKMEPLKHPKMMKSDAFSTKLRDEESDMISSMPPKKMAEGGSVEMEYGSKPEEDEVVHPEGLESDDDSMSPAQDEYMANRFAEGGEVEEDHHASVAAAIMAKRDRMHAVIDSGAMDEDDAVKMADGGMVDIDSNNEEQPNGYYNRNEDAALKENYDSDMDDVSQPMDSNEMGDSREDESENKRDMVGSIRARMKRMRS